MKTFDPVVFDYAACQTEVTQFGALLAAKAALKERKDILPFFRKRRQLSAFCGVLSGAISQANLVAWEYDLFGDFACDLVVGDSTKMAFCFIEFEEATPKSIFQQAGKKATRDWSPRFDHGYSQVIDWVYKLTKMAEHPDFEARFGKRTIEFEGALVIGRQADMVISEIARFQWRRQHVVVGSKHIRCVTFDELLQEMQTRLQTLALLAGVTASSPPPPPPIPPTTPV
jgi:hypothetical protein